MINQDPNKSSQSHASSNHSFNPRSIQKLFTGESRTMDMGIAMVYGAEEALLLQELKHWIVINQRNGKNIRDKKTWVFQTQKKLAEHFPCWSENKIQKMLDKLSTGITVVKKDIKVHYPPVLIKAKFNKNPRNQTLWYAFCNEHEMLQIATEDIENVNDLIPPIRGMDDSADSRNEIKNTINNTINSSSKVPKTRPSKSKPTQQKEEEEFSLDEKEEIERCRKQRRSSEPIKDDARWNKSVVAKYRQRKASEPPKPDYEANARINKPKALAAVKESLETNLWRGEVYLDAGTTLFLRSSTTDAPFGIFEDPETFDRKLQAWRNP